MKLLFKFVLATLSTNHINEILWSLTSKQNVGNECSFLSQDTGVSDTAGNHQWCGIDSDKHQSKLEHLLLNVKFEGAKR